MGQGEVRLEIGPSLVNVGIALPGFAIVQENYGCKEELKGGGDNLGGGIGVISGGGIVEGVFDLVEKDFYWLIRIVGGLEIYVVVIEVGCQDASVIRINMLKYVPLGCI